MEETETKNPEAKSRSLSIPIAIVVAGVLIAGAVFIDKNPGTSTTPRDTENTTATNQEVTLRPVSAADHLYGNPAADIIVVEYSDLECPYCKVFHQTLTQLMKDYGKSGKLAWVYRHFPLPELHPKASKEAEASECAAELGGNDAFWKFINGVFAVTPSNNGLDPAELPRIATSIGLNQKAFEACLASGKYQAKIKADYDDAYAAGGRGTPYSILITGNQKIPIDGAQPYSAVKAVIENLLAEKNGPAGQQAVPVLTP
ncbi:hypothetical protein A2761_03145 [Candidatus Kaiserbacteria bacterium RIFCSPHIGHO2_01_FULL_51_33]|nr:MAG: hypothetical protein A2761_03145 [Candidatus Kaiserbacteria bacterium RIFCSPHIGHO2_01_FULL_51_33]